MQIPRVIVEERLTEIQYSIANKTEPFAACTLILRRRTVCLPDRNIEYRWFDNGGRFPHQHMCETIPLSELVTDNTFQRLYGAWF